MSDMPPPVPPVALRTYTAIRVDVVAVILAWVDDHATFLVEAILIALLVLFWSLQTIDRRHEGASTY